MGPVVANAIVLPPGTVDMIFQEKIAALESRAADVGCNSVFGNAMPRGVVEVKNRRSGQREDMTAEAAINRLKASL
jgi:hypothetical protein